MPPEVWATLSSLGMPGILVALIVAGYLAPKPHLDDLRASRDRLEGQVDKLADGLRELTDAVKDLGRKVGSNG